MIKYLIIVSYIINSCLKVYGQTNVRKTDDGYSLFRDGKPYYVNGVGGEGNFKKMVEIGANSVRTWGVENAQAVLDEAQKNGITVMLGLWLNQERQGFDYDNKEKVKKQLEYYKTVVEKFKNHPALLMWGIGNELDLDYKNPNAWYAVQDIAKYIHQSDPNHPTSTVIAGLDSMDAQYIKQRCPDVEILGINTYGDIGSVSRNIKRFGWDGPYMITEWGPRGYWEAPVTSWKVSIEQNSSEKRDIYYNQFQKYILPNKNYCLGSYAFYWGAKQEYTETWFGLFSKENVPTEAIDALQEDFTGNKIDKPAPSLSKLTIEGKEATDNVMLKAEDVFNAEVVLKGMDEKTIRSLNYRWRILEESTDKKSGGDAEAEAAEIPGLIIKGSNSNNLKFRAPDREGMYRLFVSIMNNGKVAYANLPFKVLPRAEGDKQMKLVKMKYTDMKDFEQ
jgi:hypothetical protein